MFSTNKIFFISDMHLDELYDNESDTNYVKNRSKRQRFLDEIKKHKKDTIIVNGDFYNDYHRSIEIIREIDKMGIKGFWTFGNHEWHDCAAMTLEFQLTRESRKIARVLNSNKIDIKQFPVVSYYSTLAYKKPDVSKFENIKNAMIQCGKECKNFKLLTVGSTYKLGKYTLIGDVGWSSFTNNDGKVSNEKDYFDNWTEQWDFEWMKKQNANWLKFANSVVAKNKNVIIATHYPMYLPDSKNVSEKGKRFEKDYNSHGEKFILYWFSKNPIKISKDQNVIFIHGHSHTPSLKDGHHSNPIGRKKDSFPMRLKELVL
ncbi:MAG: hypothetical protein Ta2E_02380 [Mycoplasmoidaceae bacterium]|nr:MAG: hypothetical protein Ta2E_02380 [Mycoplasmoidaceae bacterium]